jgi:hypothetical protein
MHDSQRYRDSAAECLLAARVVGDRRGSLITAHKKHAIQLRENGSSGIWAPMTYGWAVSAGAPRHATPTALARASQMDASGLA